MDDDGISRVLTGNCRDSQGGAGRNPDSNLGPGSRRHDHDVMLGGTDTDISTRHLVLGKC